MAISLSAPPLLADLAGNRPLALFLDFDGTLVAIAATPGEIMVPVDLAARLEALAERLEGRLALVSGRALDDIAAHLGRAAIAQAGSHGIDRRFADGSPLGNPPAELPDGATEALAEFAGASQIDLERKSHGAALHFRSAPARERDAHEFARDIAKTHNLTIKTGKCVVELVRPGADKAGAVTAFMQVPPFVGAMPVFIGDDVTDEDGFRAANELGGFGILVGGPRETLARYRLETVEDVYGWTGL